MSPSLVRNLFTPPSMSTTATAIEIAVGRSHGVMVWAQ